MKTIITLQFVILLGLIPSTLTQSDSAANSGNSGSTAGNRVSSSSIHEDSFVEDYSSSTADCFSCGPWSCIPLEWVCDGGQDCPNNSDEENCTSAIGTCENITISSCQKILPYTSAIFPNSYVQDQQNASLIIDTFKNVANCSENTLLFMCALVAPRCTTSGNTELPCRSLCEEVQNCSSKNTTLFGEMDCSYFPSNSSVCPGVEHITESDSDVTQCGNITEPTCSSALPYTFALLSIETTSSESDVSSTVEKYVNRNCSTYAALFICGVSFPECSATGDAQLPCKALCEEVRDDCSTGTEEWMDCSSLPEVGNPNMYCPSTYTEQDITEETWSCENVTEPTCDALLPYDVAVLANPSYDSQDDVSSVVDQLVSYNCSEYAALFVCVLLLPECPSIGYPLPPCRALCEQVRDDCIEFTKDWMDCDSFPVVGNSNIYCPEQNTTVETWSCENVTAPTCDAVLPYDVVMLTDPSYNSQDNVSSKVDQFVSYNCSEYAALFFCSVLLPECSSNGYTVSPCRALCEQVRDDCIDFTKDWMDCDTLPVVGNSNIYCPEPDITEETWSCENVTEPTCDAILPYDVAVLANPSHDSQDNVSSVVDQLVSYNCSEYAALFVCVLLLPECPSIGDPLPPCRALCEQVRDVCIEFTKDWMDCDTFPAVGNSNIYCPDVEYQCQNITDAECNSLLPYNYTTSNTYTNTSEDFEFLSQNCSQYASLFTCAAKFPECSDSGQSLLPCRSLCELVYEECAVSNASIANCESYPQYGNPDIYCPGSQEDSPEEYGQCENITTITECNSTLSYDMASVPNRFLDSLTDISQVLAQVQYFHNCSEYLNVYTCGVALPACSSKGFPIFPCRSLCEQVRDECVDYINPNDTGIFDCDQIPVSGNPEIFCPDNCADTEYACEDNSCIPQYWFCDGINDCKTGDDETSLLCYQKPNSTCLLNQFTCNVTECIAEDFVCDGLPDCSNGEDENQSCTVDYVYERRSLHCENITVSTCMDVLPYNTSVFPTTFATDQTEAADKLEYLLNFQQCSPYAKLFSCAVLLPECTSDGHFYLPCRSLCEEVKASCSDSFSWTIDCDYLPEFGNLPYCLESTAMPTTMPTRAPIITDLDVEIFCWSNCYTDAASTNYRMSVYVHCYNCLSAFDVKWTLWRANRKRGKYSEVEMDNSFTNTGTEGYFLSINAGQLESGSFYYIQVNVTIDDGGYGVDTWQFATNSPPANGNCTISPTSGFAIDTKFRVTCFDWEDENTPLRYYVYSRPEGSSVSSLLYNGYEETTSELLLSMGQESYEYLVEITVAINDIYNAEALVTLSVKVEPPSLTGDDLTEQLVNLTSGENSALGEFIESGDTSGAASLVITVASVLNTEASSDTDEASVEDRKQLRESVIQDIKEISETVETVDEVSQMASAIVAMTSVPEELTASSQVDTATTVVQLSNTLKNLKNESEDDILDTADAITQSVSNVLQVSMESENGEDTLTRTQSATIARSVVEAVDSISEAVLNKRIPGQPPVIFNTSSLSVQLQRDRPTDISGSSLVSDAGTFSLPSASGLFGDRANNSYIDTKFLAFNGNPFDWDNSSDYINSDVVSLTFASEDGLELEVTDLQDDILIVLPKYSNAPYSEPVNMSNMDTASGLLIYGLELPIGMAVHFRIIPEDGNDTWSLVNYTLYLSKDRAPTQTLYNFTGTLPNNQYDNDTRIDDVTRDELRSTFFVPSAVIEESGDYFIGILADQGTFNFSVEIFTSSCRYWDDNNERWKMDGCRVLGKSTLDSTHCACNHLTSFASDFFVPPNTIDFSTVFTNFADLHNNLSIFLTVFLVLGIYILVAVWARRKDKSDLLKWGVTPLPDNKPGEKYLYQITVWTGMRTGSGTKSNVFIVLRGEKGKTKVRPLADSKREIFQRGSVCTFVMAVPESLGDLVSLRIWHNNSGKNEHASWYLSKAAILDLQTKECFYFLCERWLAVEEDDGQVQRLIPVADESDLKKFNQLFVANAKKDLTDGHIWFSVFSRPQRSHFTRLQRVSCCLSLLYTSMIASCMWYRTEGANNTYNQVIEIGPFKFTLHSLYVGVVTSLIIFPVNLVLIQLFRKSRPKETLVRTSTDQSTPIDQEEKTPLPGVHDDISRRTSSAPLPNNSRMSCESKVTKGDISINFNGRSGNQSPSKVDYETGELLYTAVTIDQAMMSAKERLNSPFARPQLLYDEVSENGSHSNEKKQLMDSEEEREDVENGDVDQNASDKTKKKKTKTKVPFMLPHWCVYIAWCLVFLSSATSAFFTILYSMQWGNDRSKDWLVSFLTSFLQSVFIIQPIKVICIAMLLAFIIKSRDPDVEVYEVTLKDDEEYLHSNEEDDIIRYEPPPFLPPDPEKLEAARERRQKEVKMWRLTREIISYLLFLAVTCILAFSNRDKDDYYLRKSVDDVFFQNEYFESIEEGFPAFGDWMSNAVLPGLYPDTWYNGRNLARSDKKFIEGLASYRLGPLRLRHLRVKSELCTVVPQFESLIPACYDEYSPDNEDKSPYNENWSDYNNTLSPDDAWLYKSANELDGMSAYGVRRYFSGGGYVADLGKSMSQSQSRLDYLWNSLWYDHRTRAVFVEFSLYNANANIFSMVSVLVEFPATGAALVHQSIYVFRLYHHIGPAGFWTFYLVCELFFLAFVIYFIVREILQLKQLKCAYFKSFWNWIEMIQIGLCLTAIVMHVYQLIYSELSMDVIHQNGSQMFVNFLAAAFWDEIFVYILSFVVFVSFLKCIHILRFNRRMALLSRTLRQAASDFGYYGLVFFIFLFAYAQMWVLIVGKKVGDYRTIFAALRTVLSTLLGVFDYEETTQYNGIIGPIVFFSYAMVMYVILTTMFIAIIVFAFAKVKKENDNEQNQYEMVSFLSRNLKDILGIEDKKGGDSDDDEDKGDDVKETKEEGTSTGVSSKSTVCCEDEIKKSSIHLTPEKMKMKNICNMVDYTGYDDLKERLELIDLVVDQLMDNKPDRELYTGFKFVINPDNIDGRFIMDRKMSSSSYGSDTSSHGGRHQMCWEDDDKIRLGRCHFCHTRMSTKHIEGHLMLRCPTIRPYRAEMFRSLIEVMGDIQPVAAREKAREWWNFYKANARSVKLTYFNEKTQTLKLRKNSFDFFKVPRRAQRDIGFVVVDFIDRTMYKAWERLDVKIRRKSFHLNDFIMDTN